MIIRSFPTKDTFITNRPVNGVQVTGSNAGSSEILHLFKIAPISGTTGVLSSASFARILTQFDVQGLFDVISKYNGIPSRAEYHLVMKDAQHDDTLPSSFDVEVFKIGRTWDEGRGHDVDVMADLGWANWVEARSSQAWTAPGGDVSGSSVTVHFDVGDEDLDADVSDLVSSWIVGDQNNGFMTKLSSSIEANGLQYYIKMFHSRETNFSDMRPYLEAKWDSSTTDDRRSVIFGQDSTLRVYNLVRGQLVDVSGSSTDIVVTIADLSGTIMSMSGTRVSSGSYEATFDLPSGSYSGSLSDMWLVNGVALSTGTFLAFDPEVRSSENSDSFIVKMPNLSNQYTVDDVPRLRVLARRTSYSPSVVHSSSLGLTYELLSQAYYRVDNDRTDEVVVPFGTGSNETKMSYDPNGNFFDFHMGSLSPGNVYRFVILIDSDGTRRFVDEGFKFKVV